MISGQVGREVGKMNLKYIATHLWITNPLPAMLLFWQHGISSQPLCLPSPQPTPNLVESPIFLSVYSIISGLSVYSIISGFFHQN